VWSAHFMNACPMIKIIWSDAEQKINFQTNSQVTLKQLLKKRTRITFNLQPTQKSTANEHNKRQS
jgi:hypothetical protein